MKYLFILTGVVCLSFMLLPACAPQAEQEAEPEVAQERQVNIEADKEAIITMGERLRSALKSDDVDGIMACLTDDHVTMAPDVPVLDDMETLRKWHEDRVKVSTFNITAKTDELEVKDDWAYERWSTSMTLTPKAGGDTVQTNGKGIWLWKRQADGSWKLARSIWNSDNPPPGEPAS